MLVLDEQRVRRNAKGEAQAAYAHSVQAWTMEQLRNARVVQDRDMAPCNPEAQLGHALPGPAPLEASLRLVSPNFVFEEVQGNATKKRLGYARPGLPNDFLGLYENGPMPEWSIMTAVWRWVPDPEYFLGKRIFDRRDLGLDKAAIGLQEAYDLVNKHGLQGAAREVAKRRAGEIDPDVRPGFKKQLETSREAIRGWRTVLVRPLQAGYLTLHQVECIADALSHFGEARANWARATGKQHVAATI